MDVCMISFKVKVKQYLSYGNSCLELAIQIAMSTKNPSLEAVGLEFCAKSSLAASPATTD